MIDDIFTPEFLQKIHRKVQVMGPAIGAIFLAMLIYYGIINRVSQEMDELSTISSPSGELVPLPEARRRWDVQVKGTSTAQSELATLVAERTPVSRAPATATPEEPSADPAIVNIFTQNACAGCHVIPGIPGAVGQVGPDLSEIGMTGATRRSDYSAEAYVRESLVDPEAYLAPECPNGACPSGIMLPSFTSGLSADDLNVMVSYLLSLKPVE